MLKDEVNAVKRIKHYKHKINIQNKHMRRRLTSITYKQNWEAKTLAVVDRLKFRDSLNWIQDIKGADLNSIKQLSNHALLLNVRKQGNEFECYFTSITSKTKSVALINVIEAQLMRFELHNGEFRYIPKVIYKYIFTRELLLNLFNLEQQNSIDLNEQIRLWDSQNVLDDWSNIIKVNECHYIDLDLIKESGILNVSIFEDKLSSSNWDIEVMKNLITNEEI